MTYLEYLGSIKDELLRTGKDKRYIRVKTIMKHFGYLRRSQSFINEFNFALNRLGLCSNPTFDAYLSVDAKIAISVQGTPKERIIDTRKDEVSGKNLVDPVQVKHDFFYYLFDFGSQQEYERFQACLDSNQPMGIFLVPNDEDFFSELVVKILGFELIRKYQYKGLSFIPTASKLSLFTTQLEEDKYLDEQSLQNASIYQFDRSTMSSVLLGTTGLDLLDSEKFDERFEQLSLYSNKYNNEQFFILFRCPSQQEIDAHQREDMLGYLVNKTASKIPFTFTLRCKYPNYQSVQDLESIYTHFRLFLEVPQYLPEEYEISPLDYFLELQKAQIQAESHLMLRMETKHFEKLIWGNESTEHIYLKYFAIRTLENIGYSLDDIHCEAQLASNVSSDELNIHDEQLEPEESFDEESVVRRPDVYIENKIIVEAETLRSKSFTGENVFLDLVNRIIAKSAGWPEKLETVWLVLPGFEVARNYYQLKKVQEILLDILTPQYGNAFQLLVMTPDYENHQLVQVLFDSINYPSLRYESNKPEPSKLRRLPLISKAKLDFSHVKGLREEKEKLSKLLKLQAKGLGSRVSGILLFGLPGCGKTLLANAFANESERYFFKFSPADIQSSWIGQSQKNIRDIFAQAKKNWSLD